MTFLQLDKTHKQIQKAVSDFIKGEFKKEILEKIIEQYSFPEDIWKKACELGLIGMHYPEKYSGQGLGIFENVLVAQSLCRGDSSVGSCLVMAGHGAELILRQGSPELKQAWLPKIAQGRILSGTAFTEPGIGNDLDMCCTTARKENDHYIINGTKTFAMNAGPLAGFYLVLCRTDQEAPSDKAFSIILVQADCDGITCKDVGAKLGRRLMDISQVQFDQVKVPLSNLIGPENKGMAILDDFFNETRVIAAAQALGMAQGAFDRALAHVKQREQFGQKIVDFQITRQKIADMATKIEAAKLMTYQAAWQLENIKKPGLKTGAMAKLFAARAAFEVCDEAIQMFGGYGYMQEYEVERFYRDVKMVDLFDGAKVMQKDIIAAELIKGKGI